MKELLQLQVDLFKNRMLKKGGFSRLRICDVFKRVPPDNLAHRKTDKRLAYPGISVDPELPQAPFYDPFPGKDEEKDFMPTRAGQLIKFELYFEGGLDMTFRNEFNHCFVTDREGDHRSPLLHMSKFAVLESNSYLIEEYCTNRFAGLYYLLVFAPLPKECSYLTMVGLNLPVSTECFEHIKRNAKDEYLLYWSKQDLSAQ